MTVDDQKVTTFIGVRKRINLILSPPSLTPVNGRHLPQQGGFFPAVRCRPCKAAPVINVETGTKFLRDLENLRKQPNAADSPALTYRPSTGNPSSKTAVNISRCGSGVGLSSGSDCNSRTTRRMTGRRA